MLVSILQLQQKGYTSENETTCLTWVTVVELESEEGQREVVEVAVESIATLPSR